MRTQTGTYTIGGVTYNYAVEAPDEMIFIHSRRLQIKLTITRAAPASGGGTAEREEEGETPAVSEEERTATEQEQGSQEQGLQERTDGEEERAAATPVANRRVQVTTFPTFMRGYDFRYTDAQGSVTVDIGRMMQVVTDNVAQEPDIDYRTGGGVVLSKASRRYIRFYDGGTAICNIAFDAHNGADDIADCWEDNSIGGPRRLKWFKSYPFTFDFPNVTEAAIRRDGGNTSIGAHTHITTTLTHAVQRVIPANISGLAAARRTIDIASAADDGFCFNRRGVLTAGRNRVFIEIDAQPYDTRKVYLRWLGKHGELFYWLFNRVSVEDTVSSETYDTGGGTRAYDNFTGVAYAGTADFKSSERRLTVHSGMLDAHYYRLVRSVMSSPVVDMLAHHNYGDERTYPLWRRVTIEAKKSSEIVRHPDTQGNASRELTLVIDIPGQEAAVL